MKKFLLIIFAAVFLLFYRLGSTTLVNWDESWLASVSQDIAIRGDWLGGQWNGQTWFYEPPLVTWTLAVLYKIFGPSEFWLRSFNASLGLLIIIVVYKLSILIAKSAASAFISVIILLSDIEFLFRSRQINVEIPVTLFLLLTIFYLLKSFQNSSESGGASGDPAERPQRSEDVGRGAAKRQDPNRRKRFETTLSAVVSFSLAFLTKRASPILILPATVYVLLKVPLSLRARRSGRGNLTQIFIFFITFIIFTLPWYLASYLKWGNQFINEFFFGYTLGKIRSVNPGAGADIFFYVTALRHAFKFFFPLIPFAIIWASVKSFRDRKIAVLTIFILTFLIFLTAAPIKSSWFLLPVHPAIAVVLGFFVDRSLRATPMLHRGSVAIPTRLPRRFAGYRTVPGFAPRNDKTKVWGITLIIIIASWQLWHYRHNFIVPDTTGHQAALAKLAGQLTPPENPIYLDDDYLPVAVFYSQRRVIPLRFNRLQPITQLPIPSSSHILTSAETLPTLQNNYPNISLIKETPDLILVQNR